ncbi:Geranylgeranyl diphosphate reductase, chloroplastic [Dendrobium catenatum]|uniref:Geranylgeranyl diphosphate reductase, chloroplastic n=1 Tax=Dendrobium catenatum TaxID=906689 RepID=A0A2I0VSU3_9ASPA|nr:Geranylgeranyl diphosphate reductase, chloroplastic [Dendrobium catenatum]
MAANTHHRLLSSTFSTSILLPPLKRKTPSSLPSFSLISARVDSRPLRAAVIGGGPAGSSASEALAAAGVETYLLERSPDGSKPCGGAIPLCMLDEFSIPEELIDRRVTRMRIISPSNLHADFGKTLRPGEHIPMLRREVLDAFLRRRAESNGTRLIAGLFTALESPSSAKEPYIVHYVKDGSINTMAVDVVIGADGANSRVAKAIDAGPYAQAIAFQQPRSPSRDSQARLWTAERSWCGLNAGSAHFAEVAGRRVRLDAEVTGRQVRLDMSCGTSGSAETPTDECRLVRLECWKRESRGRIRYSTAERIRLPPTKMERYADLAEMYVGGDVSPDFYGWVFPKCDHVAVGTGTTVARSQIKKFQAGIRARAGGKIAGGEVIRVEAHPIPEHPRPRRVRGRVALVGDAAGYVTKCSGEGIYFAAKSGRMCGEAIVRIWKKGEGMVTEEELKEEYLRKWDGEYLGMFRFLDLLQRVFYGSNVGREALVEMCQDEYVQRMTFDSYFYKRLAEGDRWRDVGLMWKTVASLVKARIVGREMENLMEMVRSSW